MMCEERGTCMQLHKDTHGDLREAAAGQRAAWSICKAGQHQQLKFEQEYSQIL